MNRPKARITGETVTIAVGKATFTGMRKVSEWNGFARYDGPSGTVILAVDTPDPLAYFWNFSLLGKEPDAPAPLEWDVIRASPDIIAAIRSANTEEPKPEVAQAKKPKHGELEGERCGRNGCDGTIELSARVDCSCHISPPCGYCTSRYEKCDSCEWEQDRVP